MTTPRQLFDLTISEAEFQTMIIQYAHLKGWNVHHDRTARTNKGWRTPIQGDPGFFDLVLAREGSPLIFAEVKREKGKLTPEQRAWWGILERASIRCYLWRPSDWDEIVKILDWEDWRPGGVMKA